MKCVPNVVLPIAVLSLFAFGLNTLPAFGHHGLQAE